MKVKTLIAKLQKLDQDTRVIISGYEGGYEDITTVSKRSIALNVNPESYYGPHDKSIDYSDKKPVKAYQIS